MEPFPVDVAQAAHEGVVLSVAAGVRLVGLSVYFYFQRGRRFQSVGRRDQIAHQFHPRVGDVVFQHVGHDEGQVVLCHHFFLVAQFYDALCHAPCLFRRQLQSVGLEVFQDVGLPAGFSQRVLPFAAEALGQEGVLVKALLAVAVGMYAGHLCEDVFAHDGLVARNGHSRVALHQPADLEELAFVDARLRREVVAQDGLHAGQRGVARPFAQSVDGGVYAAASAQDGGGHVGDGQVVVVVGVEVKMKVGVALAHLTQILHGRQRVEHAERVGQHEAPHVRPPERVDQREHIVRVLHAVGPVFQIDIDGDVLPAGVVHFAEDVGDVLFRRLLQLVFAVSARAFAEQVDDVPAARADPVDGGMVVHEAQHLHAVQQSVFRGPGADVAHGLVLAFRYPCRGHLDAVNPDVAQQRLGDVQFLLRQERHSAGLFAVAEGRVHDFYQAFFFSHSSIFV